MNVKGLCDDDDDDGDKLKSQSQLNCNKIVSVSNIFNLSELGLLVSYSVRLCFVETGVNYMLILGTKPKKSTQNLCPSEKLLIFFITKHILK